uniref:Uncharacterized protein n=1 Tax=Octopus bimaculoides TaxID=37653 RepID=A0A0L8IEV2_OCTBM
MCGLETWSENGSFTDLFKPMVLKQNVNNEGLYERELFKSMQRYVKREILETWEAIIFQRPLVAFRCAPKHCIQ